MRNLILVIGIFLFFFEGSLALQAQGADPSLDLPLELSAPKGMQDDFVIYLTGDGGWNCFNQQMSQTFEKRDYGIVALNSRKYFWNEKTLLIGDSDNATRKYKVGPEIVRSDIPIVYPVGTDENKILHGILQNSKILTVFNLPGDHQYNNNFDLRLKTIGL